MSPSRSSEDVGLGIIGLGWWGSELTNAVSRGGAGRVVACYARSEDGRAEFAAEHGCRAADSMDDLLEDDAVEAVMIATSHQSHRSLVEQVAAAGKHVFLEKPLTTTVEDGLATVAAARRAGVILQVGHQRRRTAANRRIKEMIDDGTLGDIETVVANQSLPNGYRMPEEAWRWSPEQSPLGSMTSLGVHKIDTMHYLVGPIQRVFAFSRPGRTHAIDEATVVALEFASGALATLTTSFYTPVVNEIAVFGTEAAAFNTDAGARLSVQSRFGPAPEEVTLTPVDPVVDQLVGFVEAVRGEGPVEPDGEAGLAVVAVMEAAMESVASGRAVEVQQFT